MATPKPNRSRPSKLLKVLVLGGAVLAAGAASGCAGNKAGEGKPASARPGDAGGSGGGVQGW